MIPKSGYRFSEKIMLKHTMPDCGNQAMAAINARR